MKNLMLALVTLLGGLHLSFAAESTEAIRASLVIQRGEMGPLRSGEDNDKIASEATTNACLSSFIRHIRDLKSSSDWRIARQNPELNGMVLSFEFTPREYNLGRQNLAVLAIEDSDGTTLTEVSAGNPCAMPVDGTLNTILEASKERIRRGKIRAQTLQILNGLGKK